MEIIADPYQFQAWCASLDGAQALGFVPTMGALHAGHAALIRASRRRDERTAASIFVNPTQFGPSEDFTRYPRPLEQDLALLGNEGVAVAFTPAAEAMYPAGDSVQVEVGELGERLCGASRPGHFRGVATVVAKLLQLAQPARAYFGQKDAVQAAIVRRLIDSLFLPVELVVCPIVRERDGLALSSRNTYLNPEQREAAKVLSRALRTMGEAYDAGERETAALLLIGRDVFASEPGARLEYLAAVDAATLLPVAAAGPGTLFAVAAFCGPTRLIDNAHIDHNGVYLL